MSPSNWPRALHPVLHLIRSGVAAEDGATLARKTMQINACVLLLIVTAVFYNVMLGLTRDPVLIRSALCQVPFALLAPLVFRHNRQRRHATARRWAAWLGLGTVTATVFSGQGTALGTELYFLLLAALAPALFLVSEWRMVTALVLASLALYTAAVIQPGWTDPSLAMLDPAVRQALQMSNVLTCLGTMVTVMVITERSAAANEQNLQRQALTDGMTGLPNRRHFRQVLVTEMARSRRHGEALSLLVFDIDHFKAVNDEWGHDAGDQALLQVATSAQQALRAYDVMARIGGEEFAVVLPRTTATDAHDVAERLRAAVERQPFAYAAARRTLTVSVGVVTIEPGADPDRSLREVDASLYRAKRDGRNRVDASALRRAA